MATYSLTLKPPLFDSERTSGENITSLASKKIFTRNYCLLCFMFYVVFVCFDLNLLGLPATRNATQGVNIFGSSAMLASLHIKCTKIILPSIAILIEVSPNHLEKKTNKKKNLNKERFYLHQGNFYFIS